MRTVTLVWLSIASAICVALCVAIRIISHGSDTIQTPARLFPHLSSQRQAITGLQLMDATHTPLVTLAKTEHGWWVTSPHHVADQDKVATLLDNLGELTIIAAKTADPNRFNELGVADPMAPDSDSLQLELQGIEPPIHLIIGHQAGSNGTYVRPIAATQASHVRPALHLGRSPLDWIERRIIDLPNSAIKTIQIQRDDDLPWQIDRPTPATPHVSISPALHSHEAPFAGVADALLKNLEQLNLEDLRAARPQSNGTDRSTITTFGGLSVRVIRQHQETPCWVALSAFLEPTATSPSQNDQMLTSMRRRVELFNDQHHDWQYRLADERCNAIFQKRSDLLSALP